MAQSSQFHLLGTRRFLPLFLTQFLGAFHDNLFKNAFVVTLLFGTVTQAHDPKLMTTLAAGVFILPFVLFSALGGQMADKFPKDRVIQVIKQVEIGIALLGIAALMSGSLLLSFLTLFALGTHSSFFGPSKYSILPQHLSMNELLGGNALVNTGTFLAILIGTLAGTALVMLPHGHLIVSILLLCTAIAGYISSRYILPAPPAGNGFRLDFNLATDTYAILCQTFAQPKRVLRCILGTAWFWFLGAMFISQLPNFTHETLGADEHVLSLFLVLFSIGIALGGLFNNTLLKGRLEGVYVPLAILGITFFSFDLYVAGTNTLPPLGEAQGIGDFLKNLQNWRIIFDITLIAVCGGLFVVPLNAIVQHLTPPAQRARVMAGAGILDAVMMVTSSVLCAVLIKNGLSIPQLFLTFAIANLFVALYTCTILPDYLMKSILQIVFKLLYNVEIRGIENVAKAGDRAVIVGNHVSLLDPPLLAAFLPGRPMFAVNKFVAEWWWVKPFLRLVDAFPLDPASPYTIKDLIRKVEENRQVVIFPEGRLTDTGALMKVYDGPGMIADKADAMILPVRLDGVQHTPFARLKGKVPLKSFPKITITILEPRKFKVDENLKGRARRAAAGRQLYDLMEEMMFETGDRHQTLFEALLKARYINGNNAIIAEDVEHKPMPLGKLIKGSAIVGRKLANISTRGEAVGVMLPNSLAAVTTFFALQAYGRVPAMLNFSSGVRSMISACAAAQIKTIVTSRRFVELGRFGDMVAQLSAQTHVVYLEDIRKSIGVIDTLFINPARIHRAQRVKPQDPAVILFTSGSEGEPKGVVLSHSNLMANIVQLGSRVDFNLQDIVFNCLPMFHSFGLTGGMLLPILSGIRTFFYPSPLHYKIVPEMVYATNATIMFGTDTFLQGYGRKANPYDFYRMRYIFAGAEKVREETYRLYRERFGVQILEGYGATETAPVIAVNSAMHRQDGTVGRFLSGIAYRLEPVPGIAEGGRLYVSGPNVMLGYYKADAPGVLQPPAAGWHDTGDIVSVDAEGYVRILGRAKRFAKIAGEMVSLQQVEIMAAALWPEAQHAVVALPDERKGEQLVMLTTQDQADRSALTAYVSANGITSLAVPATIIVVDKMPILGTGKIDYAGVKKIAEDSQTAD